MNLSGLGGTLDGVFDLFLNDAKSFQTQIHAKGLSIQEIKALAKPNGGNQIEGTIESFNGNFSGALSGDIMRQLVGSGNLSLKDGKLIGVNVAASVISSMKNIPFIQGSLTSYVPEKFMPVLESPDTHIKSMTGNFSITNGLITIKSLSIVSSLFSLSGRGTVSVDSDISFLSEIIFDKEFSLELVKREPKLKSALSPNQTFIIPVKFEGKAPNISVVPDLEKIIKSGVGNIAKEKLTSEVEKIAKGKRGEGARKLLEGILGGK